MTREADEEAAAGRTALPPFQTLIDAHGDQVLRMAVAMVGHSDSDDVWQDAFLKALTAYPGLPHGQNLRGWILTIAHRTALDHLRARNRSALPTDELPEPIAAELVDPMLDPMVWRAVGSLPPKQRLAIVYRYVADLSYAQIGEALNCSTDAARRSAHEGIKRLRLEVPR